MGYRPIFYLYGSVNMGVNKKLELNEIIAQAVMSLGYEYVGYEYHPQGRYSLLRIYIDSPNGIGVEDCTQVSHQVSAVLDVEDPIAGQYTLEVSSPGLERPLFNLGQCAQFIGHKVVVKMRMPVAGQRNFTGILKEVTDKEIAIELEGSKQVKLLFSDVAKANLVEEL